MSKHAWVKSVHDENCTCTRCTGFQPGHELSRKHGAYATVTRISAEARTREIADAIFELLPVTTSGVSIPVDLLAVTLRRVERACEAIDAAETTREPGSVDLPDAPLRQDLAGWIRLASKLADGLGLTPSAWARLRRDLAISADAGLRAEAALEELAAEGRRIRLAHPAGQ